MDGHGRADCAGADASGDFWQAERETSRRGVTVVCAKPRRKRPGGSRTGTNRSSMAFHRGLPRAASRRDEPGSQRVADRFKGPSARGWARGRAGARLGVTRPGVPEEAASHPDFNACGDWRHGSRTKRVRDQAGQPFFCFQHVGYAPGILRPVIHPGDDRAAGRVRERDERIENSSRGGQVSLKPEVLTLRTPK